MHIKIYTNIDLGKITFTYIYIGIHTYTVYTYYIYIHILTYTDIGELQSGGVLEGWWPAPSGVWMGSNRPDLLWQATGLDCSARIVHWRPPSGQRQGRFRGPGRLQRGGVRQIGSEQHLPRAKKVDAQMPRGALSVARRLLPLRTVLRGRGIVSCVYRCDSRKYMHIVHICMYMYVYTPVSSCCQHVKVLYSPKNDRHFRETQKVFLMSIYQLALANQETKSWPRCLLRTGSCLLV
jgi:hypothetical protein